MGGGGGGTTCEVFNKKNVYSISEERENQGEVEHSRRKSPSGFPSKAQRPPKTTSPPTGEFKTEGSTGGCAFIKLEEEETHFLT